MNHLECLLTRLSFLSLCVAKCASMCVTSNELFTFPLDYSIYLSIKEGKPLPCQQLYMEDNTGPLTLTEAHSNDEHEHNGQHGQRHHPRSYGLLWWHCGME